MRAIVLGVVAAAMLAGCEKPIEEMGYAERRELAGEILDRCAALGLKPNTPEMSQCMQVEVQKETATRRANVVRRQNAGIAMQQHFERQQIITQNQQAIAQSRQLNCTHTPGYNGAVNTRCY